MHGHMDMWIGSLCVQYRSHGTYTQVKKNSRVISACHASSEHSSLEYECSRARVILEYECSRAQGLEWQKGFASIRGDHALRSRAQHGRDSRVYSRLYS